MKKWICFLLVSLFVVTGCSNKAKEETQPIGQTKPAVEEKQKIDLESLSDEKKEDGKLRKDNAMYYLLASNINFDLDTVNVYYDQKTSTKTVHYLNFVHPSGESVEGHAEVYQKGSEVMVDVFGPFEESVVLNAKTKKIISRTNEPPLPKEKSSQKNNDYKVDTDPTSIIEQYTADTPSTDISSSEQQGNGATPPADGTGALIPPVEGQIEDNYLSQQPNVEADLPVENDSYLNPQFIE